MTNETIPSSMRVLRRAGELFLSLLSMRPKGIEMKPFSFRSKAPKALILSTKEVSGSELFPKQLKSTINPRAPLVYSF